VAPVIDVEATQRPTGRTPAKGSRTTAALALLRRHRALVILIAAALVLRIVAMIAIYPGIWFSDSNSYVTAAATGTLSPTRVSGYSLFLWPFYEFGSAGALIGAQHLIGLGMAVALYALMRHRGVPVALAVLGVAPAVLDAYLLQIESTMMSETIFHASIVATLVLLLWKDRPGLVTTTAAGVLLGYAAVVRSVGMPLIVVFLLYILVRRLGWRAFATFAVGWALVLFGYAAIYNAQHGKFGLTQSNGRFLYGKVAPFANCSKLDGVPANERYLCPDPRHPFTTNSAMWGPRSPIRGKPPKADKQIRDFATRVVKQHPLTYAKVVTLDFLHYFEPGHRIGPNDPKIGQWEFPADPNHWAVPPNGYRGPIRRGVNGRSFWPNADVNQMVGRRPHTNVTASKTLHVYQRFAYTSGQILALCVLVVVIALALRRGAWRLRLDAALLAGCVLALLLFAVALSVFSSRYGLVAPILLPAAAAFGGAALLEGRRRTADG
jgi:hypothetical protein